MKLCECGCGEPAPIYNQTRPDRGIFKGEPARFIQHHRKETKAERNRRLKSLEYEEVYPGRVYGTLRQSVEEIAAAPDVRAVVLDVDVIGALNVKRIYGDAVRTLFIAPPSLQALADRLHARGTETEQQVQTRLARAEMELSHAPDFDTVIVNDDLDVAVAETVAQVRSFLGERGTEG